MPKYHGTMKDGVITLSRNGRVVVTGDSFDFNQYLIKHKVPRTSIEWGSHDPVKVSYWLSRYN